MRLNTMSLFSFDVADKQGTLTALVKTRAQRLVRAVKEHFALVERRASLAP